MDCDPWECDHHCAQVCKQYMCPCDYKPGYTSIPSKQRVCCKWELISPVSPKTSFSASNPMWDGDILTRYFGVARSLRDPHDPVRFTGVNHIPGFLHTDYSRLDFDWTDILREREMAAERHTPPGYYTLRSIRPRNSGQ